MRGLYVRLVHGVREVLRTVGVLGVLDRRASRSRTALWVRSWLAVYDLDDLRRLDTPWWTFAASDQVADFLRQRPHARIFEWGSGASTLWLSARGGTVLSVEHDADWADRVRGLLPDNARLLLREPAALTPVGAGDEPVVASAKRGFDGLDFRRYVDAIDEVDGDLDLVVIDGRAREACLDRAVSRLARGGLIVLDNVERARYREALARHPRLRVTWTRGRTPALPYPTRTAIARLRDGSGRR